MYQFYVRLPKTVIDGLRASQKPDAATANRFLQALTREGFVEEPANFTRQMGQDTMRQQVYYWAGEWLYHQQRYDDARRFALRALPLFHAKNESRADCLNLLGIIYVRLGDFCNAANYAKQCLEMDIRSADGLLGIVCSHERIVGVTGDVGSAGTLGA